MPTRKPVLRRRRKDRWIGGSESRSLTAHFVDSLMTGAPALPAEELEIPGIEADVVRMGDPDIRPLQAEYDGDEAPGASTPTPDQNLIDATGRAYGVAHTQGGALRASSEVLDRRDEGRPGLPKSKTGRSL
ncbi:MAG TPA: DUF6335 family protein [Vicinamibacteria bacterium]|nr:DUF6335 family protein [Vicinamibacteria bacterium]